MSLETLNVKTDNKFLLEKGTYSITLHLALSNYKCSLPEQSLYLLGIFNYVFDIIGSKSMYHLIHN